ncbi:MAG: hypothetical protein E3J21_18655 [Anaerolineales bacterium]|nr:MAG: hypothetical protein E3J21_18655 [Anaerolineales bacterium]
MREPLRDLHSLQDIDLAELNLDPPTHELVQRLLNCIETLVAELDELRAENQRLRDEIARLKGEKGKPKIKANRSPDRAPDSKPRPDRRSKSRADSGQRVPRKERIKIDREEVIKLDRSQLPPDVMHRGYRDVVIQNIIFKTDNVRYRLERVYSESKGQFYEASLSEALQGQSYGSELQAFVIMLYFELRVTEKKILNLLQSAGIVISDGQISNILIKKHLQLFAEERKAVLRAGLQTTSYHHIDDTGARVAGVNHYFSTLCNPYYSSFFTHRRKNHDTVAGLLSLLEEPTEGKGAQPAVLTGDGQPPQQQSSEPCVERAEAPTAEQKQLGDYVSILICDDAPQFHNQTEHRGLCWIHEERLFKKLRPFFEAHQKLVDDFRSEIWDHHDRLKAYAAAPTEELKQELSADFDELFSRTTGYDELDRRIALTGQKKRELLLVLDFPEVPLDNNDAERALREYVIKRKISYGTRTDDGTEAWEVFLSLLDTCRKNGVNFYHYLCDWISKSYEMPSLASVVLARAQDGPS